MKTKNKVIIVGGGRVGEEIAKILSKRKESFIIIESDTKRTPNLVKNKYKVIKGRGEDEENLIEAGIKTAKRLIITSPKTETNILITLTAKELNPKIEISARAEHPKFVSKLKSAGAKTVVIPEVIAGKSLA